MTTSFPSFSPITPRLPVVAPAAVSLPPNEPHKRLRNRTPGDVTEPLHQLRQIQKTRITIINTLPIPEAGGWVNASQPLAANTTLNPAALQPETQRIRTFFLSHLHLQNGSLASSLITGLIAETQVAVALHTIPAAWIKLTDALSSMAGHPKNIFQIVPEWGKANAPAPLAGKVIIASTDSPLQPGKMLLWQPGKTLLQASSLTELGETLSAAGETLWGVTLKPCTQHPALQLVEDIQQQHIMQLHLSMREGPLTSYRTLEERIKQYEDVNALTIARIDLSKVIADYEIQRDEQILYDWFNRAAEAPERKAWLKTLRQLRGVSARAALAQLPARITPEAVQEFARTRLQRLAQERHNVTLQPDSAMLSIKTVTASTRVLGGMGKAVSQTQSMTLTEWSLQNIGWLERGHSRKAWQAGGLTPEQLIALIREADVAKSLSASLWRQSQPQTLALIATGLEALAYSNYVNQSLDQSTPGLSARALANILIVLKSPSAAQRPQNNGQTINVWQFQLGSTPVGEVFIFAPTNLEGPVIFIPDAPDGKQFRSAENIQGLLRDLLAVPGMRQHLSERMPAGRDRARMLDQTLDRRGFDPKIVHTDFFQHIWNTRLALLQAEISSFARTTAFADRLSSGQLGQNIASSLLSLVTPMLPTTALIGTTLSRVAAHAAIAGGAFREGQSEDGIFALVDALSAVADAAGGGYRGTLFPHRRLPPGDLTLSRYRFSQHKPNGLVAARGSEPGIWQDRQGQQYLQIADQWYKTTHENGQRIIFSPRNRGDSRAVIFSEQHWHAITAGLKGGAPDEDYRLVFIKASYNLDDEELRIMLLKIRQQYPGEDGVNRFLSSKQGHFGDIDVAELVRRSQQQVARKRIRQLKQKLARLQEDFTPLDHIPGLLKPLYIGGDQRELILRKHAEGAWINRLYNQYRGKSANFLQNMINVVKEHYGVITAEQNTAVNQAMLRQSENADRDYSQHSAQWKASTQRLDYTAMTGRITNEQQVIRLALQHSRGLLVGENHQQRAAMQFIIDNMALLYESGVRHLFVEDLLPETNHLDIQHFNQRGVVNARLQNHLDIATQSTQFNPPFAAEARHYNTENLLHQAHKHAITLHGLGSLSASVWRQGAERTEYFNYVAARQIASVEGITQRGEKFIALTGYYHVDNYWDHMAEGTPFAVTGLAPATQASSVVVLETQARSQPRVIVEYKNSMPIAELAGSKLTQSHFLILKAPASHYSPFHPPASA